MVDDDDEIPSGENLMTPSPRLRRKESDVKENFKVGLIRFYEDFKFIKVRILYYFIINLKIFEIF